MALLTGPKPETKLDTTNRVRSFFPQLGLEQIWLIRDVLQDPKCMEENALSTPLQFSLRGNLAFSRV